MQHRSADNDTKLWPFHHQRKISANHPQHMLPPAFNLTGCGGQRERESDPPQSGWNNALAMTVMTVMTVTININIAMLYIQYVRFSFSVTAWRIFRSADRW